MRINGFELEELTEKGGEIGKKERGKEKERDGKIQSFVSPIVYLSCFICIT